MSPGGHLRLVAPRSRILLITEGTYPDAVGGVSSWCELLIRRLGEFDWQVLPIVAAHGHSPRHELAPNAREVGRIELWSQDLPTARRLRGPDRRAAIDLPGALVRGLLGWEGEAAPVVAALCWCRGRPAGVRRVFRSRSGWEAFLRAVRELLDERVQESAPPPIVDLVEAATLYQTLYWVARTAAVPTPQTDVLHATAAGWAAIPALVHQQLHGTPLILTEHGVYVREAYLAAVRRGGSPGERFFATRLARGLTRLAYARADVVAPVTAANVSWERGLGIAAARIHVVHNGLEPPAPPTPLPGTRTVVSVGRIDPLKDVHTMLRVADETLRRVPDAQFLHYGPVTEGEEAYGRSCLALHAQLGLGERFRFMGSTSEPQGAARDADIVLMTSISEGLPMSILEAMGQGRPIVATGVGGVRDVVSGCGVVAAPGDVHALTMGVTTLLRNPRLAWDLGLRGHRRLERLFNEEACVEHYRELLATAARDGAQVDIDAPAAWAAS
jgi:polysaccharide biosynthesis protein PelF